MYKKALHEALARNYNIRIAAKILNNSQEVLLIKRSTEDNYSGIWEVPGGAVEKGESLEQALKREVLEETGLYVEKINRFLIYFGFHNIETGKTTRKFCFEVQTNGNIHISFEHQRFMWFTQKEIQSLKRQGQDEDYEIWTAHYRIVTQM